jgi:hypothetical protein
MKRKRERIRSRAIKRKRGRPQSLLTRMKGEDRTEICAAMERGSRAWRFVLLRELLKKNPKLPEDYFAEAQHHFDARLAAHERERDEIWRKYRTMKERAYALRQMRYQAPIMPPVLRLWRVFVAELGRALVRRDDDWLHDLAIATHEGTSLPDYRARFVVRVIQLFEWQPHLTVSEIFDALKKEKLPDGRLKVEGYSSFENRNRVTDAIDDIAAVIGVTPTRKNKPQRHE